MPSDPVTFALRTPGHLWFPSTRALADNFDREGGRVETLPTGHLVFYRSDGRRFLATDPAGHPLHECEWLSDAADHFSLARARFRLDWGQWVGLKPGGLVNETRLNLATKPGWQSLTPDDLRAMAAQALRVPIEEVRWFYRDEDLTIDAKGMATIRHRKDAFYALDDGGFERARFMSCMGAMHWDHIDFLPVVELFKSLLPGTGSAAFELIRGLYDDQNRSRTAPQSLRYRGIPTYPSEAAFRLFSSFFTPRAPGGGSPLTLFMDPTTSHHVTWLPAPHPPVRYFDEKPGLCLTLQAGVVQKATLAGDSAGLSYVNPSGRRVVPLDRSLHVGNGQVVLRDRIEERVVNAEVQSLTAPASFAEAPLSPLDWRTVFVQGLPAVPPADAYGSVLFYPEDDREIGELSAQPFVADYLQDLGEEDQEIGMILSRAERVLIDNGDAVISTCVLFDRPRDYTASIRHAAFAQRQAQQLWTQCAEVQRWDWLQRIRFVAAASWEEAIASQDPFDLVHQWLPYDSFTSPAQLMLIVARLREVLRPEGNAFVVGSAGLRDALMRKGLQVCWEQSVEMLPTFRMHRTILPRARVKAGLTLFHVRRT
ncbi:MAG TPA: hypothetical protein VLE03_08265 [Nitrospiraceae bacterium]|nr:hypothetical protein [Nitrospiraceae bacterium]